MWKSRTSYDVAALLEEVGRARARLDFDRGRYGHCISLPAADDLAAQYRTHPNNLPFAGALAECPTLRRIFDALEAEKASFRLLRRGPGTAYGIHDDRDKGAGVVRFQLPIATNPCAFLVAQRAGVRLDGLAERVDEVRAAGGLRFDFRRFVRTFGDWFDLFALPPGFLYRFDTDALHTAINAGDRERIVLGIDLIANDWLAEWLAREFTTPVPPVRVSELPDASWEWTSLAHGLIANPAASPP